MEKIYPITIGKKGIDDFFIMYADGTKLSWPTVEQISQWEKLYPKDIQYENAVKAGKGKEYLKSIGVLK